MENSQTINAESLPNSVPDRLVPETIPNNAKPNNANKAMFVCDNCGTEYKYITFLQVHQKRKRCESSKSLKFLKFILIFSTCSNFYLSLLFTLAKTEIMYPKSVGA